MPAAPSATALAIFSVFPVWEWYTTRIFAMPVSCDYFASTIADAGNDREVEKVRG